MSNQIDPTEKVDRRPDLFLAADGCEASESCLSCPLPRCRYDAPGGLRAVRAEARRKGELEAVA